MRPVRPLAAALAAAAVAAVACRGAAGTADVARSAIATAPPAAPARWWQGNTHTHTLWSDGDDFPEMVADRYRRAGYDFLAITDHNTIAEEERWWPVPAAGIGREAYDGYRARFGGWVEERRSGDTLRVRLRRPSEYRARLEEPGRFVLVPGEEVTQYLERRGAHVNVLGLGDAIPAQPGATLVEMIRADLAAARAQGGRTGRDLVAVLNHPNFLWSQTAEELLELPELRFFELYNGHPLVFPRGDSLHASTERMWDIVLAHRLARGGAPLYAVATDDAHDYHRVAPDQRNMGRGWIVVRADTLAAPALAAAMARGDFYASTGVELADVRRDGRRIELVIRGEPGVTYTTQFVGTRAGWDTTSVAVRDSAGRALTRRYSADVGAVLAEIDGHAPVYTMKGDELYVRARVIASRAAPDSSGAPAMAWTQPVRP